MKLSWHDLAQHEFNEAIDYYLVHAGSGIASNFASAVQTTLLLLCDHPAIGAQTPPNARRIPLNGFPFDIVYRVNPQGITIVAVANQSRRPRYWAGRRSIGF